MPTAAGQDTRWTEPDYSWTEVDGVSCVWADDGLPEFTGGLIFRVGKADEVMTNGGISHLVEHLALPPGKRRGVSFNGTVDLTTTYFWATGEREAVCELLSSVASSLRSLPLNRFRRELGILRIEDAGSRPGDWGHALLLRFGPRGQGLRGYHELGLDGVREDDVVNWASSYFTTGNCGAYLSGPPPQELCVALPPGEARPIPSPVPIPNVRYPCSYSYSRSGDVAISMLVRRSSATSVALSVATQRLRMQLRTRAGISYNVNWWYEALDTEFAHVVLYADSRADDIVAARNTLIAVLDDLASDGPTDQELNDNLEEWKRDGLTPWSVCSHLFHLAESRLTGFPLGTLQDLCAERAALRPVEVALAMADALDTALLLLPTDTPGPGGRFAEYPIVSPQRIVGREFRRPRPRPWRRRPSERLTVGPGGVATFDEGWNEAVPFDACVAVIRYDGSRGLWSDDGFYIGVDPGEWERGEEAIRLIDQHAPTGVVVDTTREADAEPEPPDDVDGAVEFFKEAVASDDENAEAWVQLAHALLFAGQPHEALRAAERACAIDPDNAWQQVVLSRALRDVDDIEGSASAARRAVELDPGGFDSLRQASDQLAAVGDLGRAERYATRLTELYPELGDGWTALGTVYAIAGDFSRAVEAARRAIHAEPNHAGWHNDLGWTLLHSGDTANAVKVLERALALDSEMTVAKANLSMAYALAGQSEKAQSLRFDNRRNLLDRAEARFAANHRDVVAARELSRALRSAGRFEEALRVAESSVAAVPSASTLAHAVESALDAGDEKAARRHLERLASSPDRNAVSMFVEAWAGAALGDADLAGRAEVEADERAIAESDRRVVRACAAAARGDWETASTELAIFRDVRPVDCCAETWCGLAAAALGDLTTAGESYRRAEKLSSCECADRRRLRKAATETAANH
jgi:tetratricopeptide (TPR) repeat protein